MSSPQQILLVSGIPATGKSRFCRYLASEHRFTYYDLECYPDGWPAPELREVWEESRALFIAELRRRHGRVVLDRGFPPHCLSIALELKREGVRSIWFQGDVRRAREIFVQRCGRTLRDFDIQVAAIASSQLPGSLGAQIVEAFTPGGGLRQLDELYAEVKAA